MQVKWSYHFKIGHFNYTYFMYALDKKYIYRVTKERERIIKH